MFFIAAADYNKENLAAKPFANFIFWNFGKYPSVGFSLLAVGCKLSPTYARSIWRTLDDAPQNSSQTWLGRSPRAFALNSSPKPPATASILMASTVFLYLWAWSKVESFSFASLAKLRIRRRRF